MQTQFEGVSLGVGQEKRDLVRAELRELSRKHTPWICKLAAHLAKERPKHRATALAIRLLAWADTVNGRIAGLVLPRGDGEGGGEDACEVISGLHARRVSAEVQAKLAWRERGDLGAVTARLDNALSQANAGRGVDSR